MVLSEKYRHGKIIRNNISEKCIERHKVIYININVNPDKPAA